MICKHCQYTWTYTGIAYMAKCSRCGKYTKVPDIRAHLEALAKKQHDTDDKTQPDT